MDSYDVKDQMPKSINKLRKIDRRSYKYYANELGMTERQYERYVCEKSLTLRPIVAKMLDRLGIEIKFFDKYGKQIYPEMPYVSPYHWPENMVWTI